jgi:DNA-binding transcriptional LysR family regulator
MQREDVSDLLAFLAVAREQSFTRAAAKLGVSQSALSHTIRGLEARLGLRLLTRTTRSVSPTEAGERLLRTVGHRFDEIEAELEALGELREKPAGTIRLTTTDYAADTILWPKLAKFLPDYPDIKVEVIVDYALTDAAPWPLYGSRDARTKSLYLIRWRPGIIRVRRGHGPVAR